MRWGHNSYNTATSNKQHHLLSSRLLANRKFRWKMLIQPPALLAVGGVHQSLKFNTHLPVEQSPRTLGKFKNPKKEDDEEKKLSVENDVLGGEFIEKGKS